MSNKHKHTLAAIPPVVVSPNGEILKPLTEDERAHRLAELAEQHRKIGNPARRAFGRDGEEWT